MDKVKVVSKLAIAESLEHAVSNSPEAVPSGARVSSTLQSFVYCVKRSKEYSRWPVLAKEESGDFCSRQLRLPRHARTIH